MTTRTAASRPDRLNVPGAAASLVVLNIALLLWYVTLPVADAGDLTDLGLVSGLPPAFYLSLAMVAAGFAWQVVSNSAGRILPYLYLAAAILILHGTPILVYGTLRYSWAWKHIGVVDFIQRNGGVDPTVTFLAAYHNWPGLFMVTAWIADRFSADPLDIASVARFTPLVLNLALLPALLWLLSHFTEDRRLRLVAGWLFVAGNWVGQDYFSPQGVTFLLYVILIGLLVGPLQRWKPETGTRTAPPSSMRKAIGSFLAPAHDPPHLGPPARILLAAAALAIIGLIVVTHQLTPLVVILALAALVATGKTSPTYLVFAIVAEAAWLLWGSAPFVYAQLQGELASLGSITKATSKLASIGAVSEERAWVIWVGRLLSAILLLMAISGGLRLLSQRRLNVTAAALLIAPMPMIAMAYGGEVLFRVYLFALPFVVYFAAATFFPSRHSGQSNVMAPVLFTIFVFTAVGFLFANNGKDREYSFTPDEVAAASRLYSAAPRGSLLIEGARSYPSQFMNYENFTYLPISEEGAGTRKEIVADPEKVLARWMEDPRWTDAFIILTRSQKAYLEAGGYMEKGAFDAIEAALLSSPKFVLEHASKDVKIFGLREEKLRR